MKPFGSKRGLLATAVMLAAIAAQALAAGATHLLPYVGRLLDDAGKPVAGAVDLQLAFYGSEDGNDLLSRAPMTFARIGLKDGVFDVELSLDDDEYNAIFASGAPVFLQVQDVTHDRTYRRARYKVPADAKVIPPPAPVANAGGVPLTGPAALAATAPGMPPSPTAPAVPPPPPPAPTARDLLVQAAGAACLASPVAGAKFVTENRDRAQNCATACAAARPSSSCVRGWTVYAGGQYFDYGNECGAADPAPGSSIETRLCCCLTTAGPATLTTEPKITH